ncbi:FERM domain-containing protein 5 isoform X1 [Frankliniella occidentalis]|uniref:Moesin/ezrin/radixin homolog 1 n=1 Tax=Frankliniella occidentalis TaxID=133901 RepID=A0A6J1SSP7_FRAOC|nr:FERM domain-containing protein 5 isoform X1 [Frankliniella occidentalis]
MLRFGSRNDVNTTFKCTVRLLDDTEVLECEFQAVYEGKDLLDQVCQQLNLVEKDYFGLRYVDLNKQRHWLDLNKTILKQVKYVDPLLFSFRVKFYPPDPFRLKEEISRYQVYLQLRRDLLHGRLYCTSNEAALLAAYVVQADLGDFNPEDHEGNYVQDLRLLLKQTPQIEEKIIELHQTHLHGQSPQEVETNFLRRACVLDTYGVDPHPVKDHRGNQLYLGINHLGILTFQGSRKTHHFRWPEVHKINYEGKMFIVHLTYNEDPRTKKKQTVGFKCPTGAACRHVWRCAIEQMLFFTLPSGSVVPVVSGGSFFSFGTKFKYTGRTERELLEEVGPLRQEEPTINRLGSLRRKASSVPATPSSPTDMSDICYLPRSNHSVPDSRLDGGPSLLASNDEGSFCLENNLPLLETVSEDHEIHSRQRNTGGSYGNLFCDNQSHNETEVKRKSSLLSMLTENFTGDCLEDIQEEDEEEDEDVEDDNNDEKLLKSFHDKEIMNDNNDNEEDKYKHGEVFEIICSECKSGSKDTEYTHETHYSIQGYLLNQNVQSYQQSLTNNDMTASVVCTDKKCGGQKSIYPQLLSISLKSIGCVLSERMSYQGLGNKERDLDMMDGAVHGITDYYLREPYDQSSTELIDGQGRSHRSSRSQTPVARGKTGSKLSLNSGALVPAQGGVGENSGVPNQESLSHRVRLRASYLLPAVIFTGVLLLLFFALVLESPDDGVLAPMRRLPEVVAIRTLYYEPAKEFLRGRITAWME